MKQKRKSSGFAVFIILVGVALILMNYDILSWEMFWGITKLWPLLLVAVGLSILFKHIQHINLVIWLVFIGVVIGYSYLNIDQKTWFIGDPVEMETFNVAMNTDEGDFKLDMAVCAVDIITVDSKNITYSIPATGLREHNVSEDDKMNLEFRDNSGSNFFINFQNRSYDFSIRKETAWNMEIDAGVVSGHIDLSDISIGKFNLDAATGDVHVKTSDDGYYNIDLAAGNIEVDVPEELPVRVRVDKALGTVKYPDSFEKKGDYVYSPTYDSSQPYIDVYIDLATGKVEIK